MENVVVNPLEILRHPREHVWGLSQSAAEVAEGHQAAELVAASWGRVQCCFSSFSAFKEPPEPQSESVPNWTLSIEHGPWLAGEWAPGVPVAAAGAGVPGADHVAGDLRLPLAAALPGVVALLVAHYRQLRGLEHGRPDAALGPAPA